MKRDLVLLLSWMVSCLMSACTHDYDQFDANGAASGAAGAGGATDVGGAGGNTAGSGGSTAGSGGNTGGTDGATGGAGGFDAGTDAPDDVAVDAGDDVAVDAGDDVAVDAGDDVAVDAPDDAGLDAAVPCTDPGALAWSQNGHCYFALAGPPRNWSTQRDACVSAGAHLVTITSQEENAFVSQMVGVQDRWIGLRKPQAGEPFSWVTGEPVSYTAWDAGEPNETGEACARLRANTNPQTWADRPCNQTFGAICERP